MEQAMVRSVAARLPTVAGLDDFGDEWILESDSQDVEATLENLGLSTWEKAVDEGIGGLFVLLEDGDYMAVYGFVGSVGYSWKMAHRLYPDCAL